MKRYRVLILPKKGLLDPEGRAIKEMLVENGYPVKDVQVGKVLEITVDGDVNVDQMVQKFLVNPLIEEYLIE
ncbi:phosphoribosylformylglycinamidine synthase subunit PurS [Thermocrinis minervae]|uniref:Phosphoribosylformylglycinamidine synthase subunit PurS n=1 Tax=Thermocrinis minervae TaxID=381751 RepID=A0A1M6RGI2_9AQUI|nr:phosphoribosylformylglycinamidine synthase subunit PurS [Thermocrinis minervae]SHK31559.1 phosphoribosylformylglycinamidine synthase [Thermocrinis minervae]